MDTDIKQIEERLIAAVVEHEAELLVVRDQIQKIIDDAAGELAVQTNQLRRKFEAQPETKEEDFPIEYRALQERIKNETQQKLDAVVQEAERVAAAR